MTDILNTDDLDYDKWFVCDEEAEPSRRVRRPRADPFEAVKQSLRKIVREELRKDRDLQSFAAASGTMTMDELQEHLGLSRGALYNARKKRDLAATKAEADAAFPPEYGKGRNPRWKRCEVDAWFDGQKRG